MRNGFDEFGFGVAVLDGEAQVVVELLDVPTCGESGDGHFAGRRAQ